MKGFTLVELIITVVILAIAVTGTLTMLGGMTRQGSDAERQTLALHYGRMRMEQILSKRFDEMAMADFVNCTDASATLGLDASETVENHDDVDDLQGWEGTMSSDPLAGTGLKTRVTVKYVTAGTSGYGTLTDSASKTCFKRIKVEVKDSKTNQLLLILRTIATPIK